MGIVFFCGISSFSTYAKYHAFLRYTLRNERKYLTANCDEVEKCRALFQNDSFETAEIKSCAQSLYEYLTTAASATSYSSNL
jgi:hypothetical protein